MLWIIPLPSIMMKYSLIRIANTPRYSIYSDLPQKSTQNILRKRKKYCNPIVSFYCSGWIHWPWPNDPDNDVTCSGGTKSGVRPGRDSRGPTRSQPPVRHPEPNPGISCQRRRGSQQPNGSRRSWSSMYVTNFRKKTSRKWTFWINSSPFKKKISLLKFNNAFFFRFQVQAVPAQFPRVCPLGLATVSPRPTPPFLPRTPLSCPSWGEGPPPPPKCNSTRRLRRAGRFPWHLLDLGVFMCQPPLPQKDIQHSIDQVSK